MPVVGLRELSRDTRQVIEQLQKDGEPVIVTRHGKAVASLTPISDEQQAAALALAVVPEYTRSRDEGEEAIAAREGKPASQLLAELDAEDAEQNAAVEVWTVTAADKLETVSIPAAWTREIAQTLVRSIVGIDIPTSAAIEALSTDLVDVFVMDSLSSAVERVRRVNENIIAVVVDEGGEISEETYAIELKRVTDAERLTLPAPLRPRRRNLAGASPLPAVDPVKTSFLA